ncbi:Pectinesterase, catalytic [Sesbania bispinosa]|nr:Pectinesterase, catalytic [Sesbania bispinosa]
MAPKIFSISYLLAIILVLAPLSIANAASSSVVPPETICGSTVDPAYCKTVLANQNGNIYDYGRISIRKSMSQSRKFMNLVDSYLQGSSSLSQSTVRALQDCKFLAELSFEYLSNTYATTNQASDVLPTSQADDFETILSAVLTNQQTCLDGLQTTASDVRVKNDLSSSLSDDTKLHSVSLALFLKGWVPEKKIITSWQQNGRHLNFKNGRLPLKMSNHARSIYDSARRHGRKLLQTVTDNESVVVSDIVVVSQDGSGNFTTINDAIAAAPNNSVASNGYFMIFITQAVVGQGFVATNITFRNTAGPSKMQAVALRSGADMSTFYSCSFEGYQDTLYTHSMRQFYRECDIYGTVDFIFGNAAVVLQNCNIYPRLPLSGQFNTITAQGRTDPSQNTGTSIQNATIKAADDLAPNVGTVQTYLGRPWKQYSRTVVMQSFMDSFINPAGWHEWSGDFALSTLYYAEYANTGPGSDTTNRVTWPGYHVINATDAANFTVSNLLSGDNWLPQTGVPYLSGLI